MCLFIALSAFFCLSRDALCGELGHRSQLAPPKTPLQSAGPAKSSSGGVSANAMSGMALRKAVNHPYHYLSRLADLEAEVWWRESMSSGSVHETMGHLKRPHPTLRGLPESRGILCSERGGSLKSKTDGLSGGARARASRYVAFRAFQKP